MSVDEFLDILNNIAKKQKHSLVLVNIPGFFTISVYYTYKQIRATTYIDYCGCFRESVVFNFDEIINIDKEIVNDILDISKEEGWYNEIRELPPSKDGGFR